MIFDYFSRGEVSRWARSNLCSCVVAFLCQCFCLYDHHIISSATSCHFHFKLTSTSAVSFPPSLVLFPLPLCSKVSRWDKSDPERYNYISSITSQSFFFILFFYNTIIKTAEKQVPSAHCTKNTRATLTMKSSPADEHLLFLFCSGVSLPICLILLFLCLSASPPLFQMIVFNTCVSSCFVVHWLLDHTAPSLLTHQFITHPSKNVIAENVFFSPLSSPFPFAARSPGEQEWLGKRCYISLSLFFCNWLLWVCLFCVHFFVCSAGHLQCSFCLTPGYCFVLNQMSHRSFNVKGRVWQFGEWMHSSVQVITLTSICAVYESQQPVASSQ